MNVHHACQQSNPPSMIERELWPPDDSRMSHKLRTDDCAPVGLGSPLHWSPSLRTAVSTILETPHPTMLLVGPMLVQIYNDAFLPLLGDDALSLFGHPARDHPSTFFRISEQAIATVFSTGMPASFVLQAGGSQSGHGRDLAPLDMTLMPSRDAVGAIQGVIVYAHSKGVRAALHEGRAASLHASARETRTGVAWHDGPEGLERIESAMRAADHYHQRVIATLAHELRVPLSALGMVAGMLARPELQAPEIARCQAVMSRQLGHMARLTEDLLDTVRVARNSMVIERSAIDLVEVAREAAEAVGARARASGHCLVLALCHEPAEVLGERTRLFQVLTNLLGNAIKFTPEPGRILLQVTASRDRVDLTVADNGIGMSAELIAVAFDFFTQGQSSASRHVSGLGIGLALVKTLVHLHGGTLHVESEGAGKGSSFRISLPRVHRTTVGQA